MSTTYEEATRCPKCEMPGDVTSKSKQRSPRGPLVEIHMTFCRNDKCDWYNTSWIVQVNEDGSVPEAYTQLGPKQFPKLSPESETRVREAMEAQLRAETSGQGEIRNPHG